MNRTLVAVALLLSWASAATAQDKQQPAAPKASTPPLEAKVRKVWDMFKTKDKATLASMLDDRFCEVEEGATGVGDKKAEIAMVDEFEITTYTLKDFKITPLGPNSALVTYLAHYEGKAGNEAVNANSAFGEIWVRTGGEWKGLYAQETTIKPQ